MHESPHSTCLHTASMHTSILCMHACVGAFALSVRPCTCASWVMVSPALKKAEQFAHGEVRVQQITVFASLSRCIQEEILVSTTQILLSIYPVDYMLQIIEDNSVA